MRIIRGRTGMTDYCPLAKNCLPSRRFFAVRTSSQHRKLIGARSFPCFWRPTASFRAITISWHTVCFRPQGPKSERSWTTVPNMTHQHRETSMLFSVFFQQSRKNKSQRRRPLAVEHLEDRCVPSTFDVLNLNDSGAGSLRQAILSANAHAGADIIDFNVAGTIRLTSGALPAITGDRGHRRHQRPGVRGNARGRNRLQPFRRVSNSTPARPARSSDRWPSSILPPAASRSTAAGTCSSSATISAWDSTAQPSQATAATAWSSSRPLATSSAAPPPRIAT